MDEGLRILVDPVAQSRVVALCLWVKTGSCDELEDQLGAAHFVEHMLFKGTSLRGVGEVAQEVEGLGGDINAFTTYDHTAYYATVPKAGWQRALAVLADMTQNSLFDETEVELEREVILEEIRGGGDDPMRSLSEAVNAQLFPPHPYARPVIGTARGVRKLQRQALIRFWKRWYKPSNMILSVSGPVSGEEVELAARSLFRSQEPAPEPSRRPAVGVQKRMRSAILRDRFDEPAVELAFRGVSLDHPDAAAMDVLAGVLAGSPASVLGSALQQDRCIVVDTWAVCECERDAGLLVVGLSPLRGKMGEAAQAAAELLAQVRAGHHLDLSALERSKTQIVASRLFGEESVESRAMNRAWYQAFWGDPEGSERYMAQVEAVSLADLRRVAATVLDSRHQVLGALLPEGEDPPATLRSRVRATRAERPRAGPPVLREVLDNGLTVLVEPLEHSKVVALQLVGLGGGLTEGTRSAGRADLWSQVVGIPGMDPKELADFLDRRGGSLNGVAGDNSIGLRCEFPARYLDEGLELLGSLVRDPDFDVEEFERVRTAAIENEELAQGDPSLLAWRKAARLLYGRHPYGIPTSGTVGSLRALSVASLERMHARDVRPSNLVLAVVGGVDPVRVLRRVRRLFGWKDRRAWRLPPRPKPDFPQGVPTQLLPHDREQSHVLLAFPGARFASPDADALTLASAVLGGQSGRLFVELRDKRGLAYSVGAESADGWDVGRFTLYMSTDQSHAEEALEGLTTVYRELAQEGPAAEELERARASALGALEMSRQRSSARALELAYSERYGRVATRARELAVRSLQRVSCEQVRRVLSARVAHSVGVLAVSE